jgi:hypothetical protein
MARCPSVPVLLPSSQLPTDLVRFSHYLPVQSLFFLVGMSSPGDSSRVYRGFDPFGSANVPLEQSPFGGKSDEHYRPLSTPE